MKHIILVAPAILLALWACSVDEPAYTSLVADRTPQTKVEYASIPEEHLIQGSIVVRVSPEFGEVLEKSASEDGLVDIRELPSLTKASETMCISNMRRLFPYAGKFEARTRAKGMHLWYIMDYDKGVSVTSATEYLSRISGIVEIEPQPEIMLIDDGEVVEVDPTRIPELSQASSSKLPFDDPLLAKQWHYYNDGTAMGSQSGCDINVVPVWKYLKAGDPDVIVSIVDGGIDYSHEDLADNMWHNPEKSGKNQYGYNFCTNNYVLSSHDHGTHVAGTVAAVNNNGIGVCGVAGGNSAGKVKGCKLMSCQIFSNSDGSGSGAAAIKWGADNGAVISQNSWGYTVPCEISSALKAAVDYFNEYAGFDENGKQTGPMAGGVVIFAAGNDNSSEPYGTSYKNLVSVTSVGANFCRAYYSNYGDWCNIAAPGGDYKQGNQVYSTLPGGKYGYMQGTSMACPHVSGVAALMVANLGGDGFTASDLTKRLLKYTTDISGYDRKGVMGKGLVNAYMAIRGGGGKAPEAVKSITLSSWSNNVDFSLKIPKDSDDGAPYTISIYFNTADFTSTEGLPFANFYVDDRAAGEEISGTITGLEFNTTYYMAAVAVDLAGNKSSLSARKTVLSGGNNAPVLELAAGGSVEPVSIKSHEEAVLNFKASDPDGHFVSFRAEGDTTAVAIDTTDFSYPNIVITGRKVESGSYTAKFVAFDPYGAETSVDIPYTIAVNNAPEVVAPIGDRIIGSGMGVAIPITESDFFADPDGEPLDYTITTTVGSVADLTYVDGIFNLTPMNYGITEFTVTGSDCRAATASQSFRVLVRDGSQDVDLYPNPVKTVLNVRTSEKAEVALKITGALGVIVYDETIEVDPFAPSQIDMSENPSGVYAVEVKYGDKQIKKNIVKL